VENNLDVAFFQFQENGFRYICFMNKINIPEGYQAVMPYLILPDATGFIEFAEKVFGGVQRSISYRDDAKTVMHAEVNINEAIIMCCDRTNDWKPQPASLFIYVQNADATYEKAVAAGSETIMPLCDQPYGRTCGIGDPFGNTWWITSVAQ
jgi:PhnB protein